MTKIRVICPSCGNDGNIEILEKDVMKSDRGIITVNVPENSICSHSFIVYVDKNLDVRDYFIADFTIELPKITTLKKFEVKKVPTNVPTNLIKLNLPALLVTYVIKSIFSKKDFLILLEEQFLYEHIRNFLNYITQDTFEINISLANRVNFKKDKELYKNHIICTGNKIVKDKRNILSPAKTKIEKRIVQKFFVEREDTTSLIILKNEIQKIYDISNTTAEFIKNHKEGKLQPKHVISYLNEAYNVKIPQHYLNYLLGIVKNYFGVQVPKRLMLTFF